MENKGKNNLKLYSKKPVSRKSYYSSLPTITTGTKVLCLRYRGMKRSVQHAFSLSGIQIPFGADTVENTQSIQSFSQTDYCGNCTTRRPTSRILTHEGYIETTDSNGSIAKSGNWRLTYFERPPGQRPGPSPPQTLIARFRPRLHHPLHPRRPTPCSTTDYYPFGLGNLHPEGLPPPATTTSTTANNSTGCAG